MIYLVFATPLFVYQNCAYRTTPTNNITSATMRFSLASAAAALSFTATLSSAFVMTTFSDGHCGRVVQTEVNVWDSTCATWPEAFGSFKVTKYGGINQDAWFFAPDNCGSLPGALYNNGVAGGAYGVELGECVGFGGAIANAVASY
jgi:hypothetical protein